MTDRLCAEDLSVAFGDRTVLHELNLSLPDGKITAIIGPNGCGKSTLLRTLARLISPAKGRILLDGAPITAQPTRAVAQQLAILPQVAQAPPGIRVEELVMCGRTPHQSPMRPRTMADQTAVQSALESLGLADIADRRVENLSGGQRQRVWIAMTLAQETGIVLLDEPTTYLDLPLQIEVLKLIRTLSDERGLTTAMVLHDINLAARFADHVVAIRAGRLICAGPPAEMITSERMLQIFDLDCVVIPDPVHATPHVVAR